MPSTKLFSATTFLRDLIAGTVVFLVALPLCLGVALASNAPLFSGLLAGIVGGILVGMLSGSHSSVSGPAAGLTAVVAVQIAQLGSFQAFLLAVMLAGVIQVALGIARAGFIAIFFPSSVIKGLLSAIGVILILKQIPHVIGHDTDPEGEMSFMQPDRENTFSEFAAMLGDIHPGAAAIGLLSLVVLVGWDRIKVLKKSVIPSPLIVVLMGVGLNFLFRKMGPDWSIGNSHLVQVPIAESFNQLLGFLQLPDFTQWNNPAIYSAALTIAMVASLETLLNLEAVDKIDPKQRQSPTSRELLAQGIGNIVSGLIGGIPVTSVIVRSSVNINSGRETKLSAVFHGVLLLLSVTFMPQWLNSIPLSSLAAILLITGVKLIHPTLIKQVWSEGRYQFIPFAVTIVAIVLSDLLIGILIGLGVSLAFILNSNFRRPLRVIVERHLGSEVVRIDLANQVSFLNRAAIDQALERIPSGGHVLLDAQNTVYIDPDILSLIRDFKDKTGPARNIRVSLRGFREKYRLRDEIQFVDYSTKELQGKVTPRQVLQFLKEGNDRFRSGHRISRDLGRQLHATAEGQHPLAIVLTCIDSRTPAELVFDLGLGDIFCVRVAGNVTSPKVLGSLEYGCLVAGAKLILVMGHTRCGAVTAAIDFAGSIEDCEQATGCQHLRPIVHDIQQSIDSQAFRQWNELSHAGRSEMIDEVAKRNVLRSVNEILTGSQTIAKLVREDRVAVVGAMYDVASGRIDFLTDLGLSPHTEVSEVAAAVSSGQE